MHMRNDDFINSHRLTDARRVQILNNMDSAASRPATREKAAGKKTDHRRDKRYEFRLLDVPCTIEHLGGGVSRILVCARNLSAGGLSFLHGGFLHQNSKCAIRLKTLDGEQVVVPGHIVSCRHVDGIVHEIGVCFNHPIDPDRFVNAAAVRQGGTDDIQPSELRGRLLYLDPSEADRKLVAHMVKATGIQYMDKAEHAAALEEIKQFKVDILFTELQLEGVDGTQFIKDVRAAGFSGPIILVTADSDEKRLANATKAGASSMLRKPYNSDELMALLTRVHKDIG
ncbi:MAG TPA: response regulator, partial [Phycisphaerales bacterium]|nr:response regulator [Phycisphaerales bacterium]